MAFEYINDMKTSTRQSGQGITSFIIGLLLATLVIAGILFYLNKSKSDFKTQPAPAASVPSKPEILTPTETSTPVDIKLNSNSASVATTSAITASGNSATIESAPAIPPATANHAEHPDTTSVRPDSSKAKTEPAKPVTKPAHKVTPAEILNSGSVEKAEQLTKAQNSKVILQIGSYNNRQDADAQRAKLVMLGIDSHIQPARINGATRYRVLTSRLDQNQVKQIKDILQQHHIDSLVRRDA